MENTDRVQEPEQSAASIAQQPEWHDREDELEWLEEEWSIRIKREDDDQPTGIREIPSPDFDNRLADYEAMLLYSMIAHRFDAVSPDSRWTGADSRPLYDWFVNAINIAPMCDTLFGLVAKLAEWRRTTRPSRSRQTADKRKDNDASPPLDWVHSPEIHV